MGKQFYEESSLSCFVLRDIKSIHEPLISILKIVEEDDDTVTLVNLMTGFVEKTTKDRMYIDYNKLTGEELQRAFEYVHTTHEPVFIDDVEGTH